MTNHISFSNNFQEVMRITANGITVTPGVSVDEAAQCVLNAIENHISNMFAEKDKEITKLKNALRPFAGLTNSEKYIKNGPADGWCNSMSYQVKDYRLAREAIGNNHE